MPHEIEFDEKEARETEALYLTPDIAATRRRTLELLAAVPGEAVIDIGAGPGLLACEIADAVGPSGRLQGIDFSAPMVAMARKRCGEPGRIDFDVGDAAALPGPDGVFDAAVSVQVYEYVPDIPAALSELRRVLKAGGRAVIMATDGDSLVLHSEDPKTTHTVIESWRDHCPHPDLPRRLRPMLASAGLDLRHVEAMTILNTTFSRDRFAYGYLRSMSVYAARQGRIGKQGGKQWVAGLERLDACGAFFFSLNRYLFVASNK